MPAPQTDSAVSVAATGLAPRRPQDAEPHRLVADFDGNEAGASSLAEIVRTAAQVWGASWAGSAVGRLAHAQATWLLRNDHPESTHLYLHAAYDADARAFVLTVGDPGGLLPTLAAGDQWRQSLGEVLGADSFHHGGRDRRLRCVVRIRSPWRVRITWDNAKLQGTHPRQSFQDCATQEDLYAALQRLLSNEAVCAVEWQGPEDAEEVWHEPDLVSDGTRVLPMVAKTS